MTAETLPDDQSEVIAFLADPVSHGGLPVEHVETHGAHVFLVGDTALKVKRAVRYDYMDFSTLEKRRAMLQRELELNRAAAPEIYRDLLAITREGDGRLALGSAGVPVEWVLRMRRFAADAELSAIAARGALDDRLADELGRAIAAYHEKAPRRELDESELIASILRELRDAYAGMGDMLDEARVRLFDTRALEQLDALTLLLKARSQAGEVRRVHGDLHLGNLVLIDGRPVPFDALEFDERLGTCDVLYDLGFLLMDLCHRGLPRAANVTMGAYLFAVKGAQDSGMAALPLFMAVRAAIRSMVLVQTGRARGDAEKTRAEAQQYLDEALAMLAPQTPRLIAVGGRSGTGKTALARGLAPEVGGACGAVHLRSDLERKALAGVDVKTHLPPETYTKEASDKVYARLFERADALLRAGSSVVLDAAFLDPAERDAAEALAADRGVRFDGVWLEAPTEQLVARVTARKGDASDADAAVVRKQLGFDVGPIYWHVVDTSGMKEATLGQARAVLRLAD